MRNLLWAFIFGSIGIAKGQNLQLSAGTSHTSIDWRYVYPNGLEENFFTSPIVGTSMNIGLEYFERNKMSLSSNLGLFQSGGKISPEENHPNFKIEEATNNANNLSLGTQFNYLPINNRLQLILSAGPRLDYLLPRPKSAMDMQKENIRRLHVGITGSLGLFYQFENLKIGVRSSYLHRLNEIINREPTNTNNWWENQSLGVKAKDQFIVTNELIIGISLGDKN